MQQIFKVFFVILEGELSPLTYACKNNVVQ